MGRKPGPLCGLDLGDDWIDAGTKALTRHLPPGVLGKELPGKRKHELLDEVKIPLGINRGLRAPDQNFMISLLGLPRRRFTQECLPATNTSLLAHIDYMDLGHFEEQGLRPALASLRDILKEIRYTHPEVHAELRSAGMLCCRYQRGRNGIISNHSWGTAIDLKLCGRVDVPWNGTVQFGLTLIAPIFNSHGWVWGAAYRKEDGMHFEVGKEKLLKWKSDGVLEPKGETTTLKRGSYGARVTQLQLVLNRRGAHLMVNGRFDESTEVEVRKFQKDSGLVPDGLVGPLTKEALGITGR